MAKTEAVEDPAFLRKFQEFVKLMVEDSQGLNQEVAASRGWVIVPAERGRHLEFSEASILSEALQRFGQTECYAWLLERIQGEPGCLRVPVTREGLFSFSQEYSVVAAAFFPADESFIILFTSGEYNLFAGKQDFVEAALGKTAAAARAEFDAFAEDECWQGRLLQVASRYKTL